MKRGRTVISDAERKNISISPEAQVALNRIKAEIAKPLGFTPTLTQTVLWLVKDYETRAWLTEREKKNAN